LLKFTFIWNMSAGTRTTLTPRFENFRKHSLVRKSAENTLRTGILRFGNYRRYFSTAAGELPPQKP
jgi:hypothetical protein